MYRWRAPLAAIFLRFSYIIVDDGINETIASEQSQHSLTPPIWTAEQPDPWQGCRFLKPLPAHGAQRAPGQKPTQS